MSGQPGRSGHDLGGKHVVITGASKGVGAELARVLVSRGCRVTAIARSEPMLRQQSLEIGTNPVTADLADLGAYRGLLGRIVDEHGQIDALVNNAAHPGPGAFTEVSACDLQDALTVNLLAPMELARQAAALMHPRGSGQIVNVSSIAAGLPLRNNSLYTVSKGGITYLSRSLVSELRDSGITVTLVVLGIVRGTELLRLVSQDPVMARTARLFSSLPSTTPHAAATAIADGMERQRSLVVVPRAYMPFVRARHALDAVVTCLTGRSAGPTAVAVNPGRKGVGIR